MTKTNWTTTALAGALVMTGCGGGGDGGDSGVTIPTGTRSVAATAGSDVTTANATTLGADLALAVLNGGGDALLGTTAGTDARPSAAAAAGPGAAQVQRRWLRQAAEAGERAAAGPSMQATAVSSETQPCVNPGGSFTVTVDDADNNQRLTRNDSVTLAAFNCVLDPSLPAANGSFRLVFNAVELSGQEPVAIDASVTFTGFSVAGQGTANGAARFWWRQIGTTGEQWRIGYQAMSFAIGTRTTGFDFDIAGTVDATGTSFELGGGLVIGGNTYSVVPRSGFRSTGSAAPASGAVELRDVAGDLVRLTARSATTYDLDYYPAGATAPTFTQAGLAWPGSGT